MPDEHGGREHDKAEKEPAAAVRGEEHHGTLTDHTADENAQDGVDDGAEGVEGQVASVGDVPASRTRRGKDSNTCGEATQEKGGSSEAPEVFQRPFDAASGSKGDLAI